MTNKEWTDLIAKEFGVSNSCAKGMLHAMYEARKVLSVNKDTRKAQAEKDAKDKKQMEAWEESDKEAFDTLYER